MPIESTAAVALATVLGLCIGSFLNVVIHRLPKIMEQEWAAQCSDLNASPPPVDQEKLGLATPRSRCPECGHRITALENIPLISYFFVLRGRCSACHKPISRRYPLVELLTGLLSAFTVWHFGPTLQAAGALLLLWALIALAAIDFDTQLLPDAITLPLLWLGLLFNLGSTYVSLDTAVIGAIAGYLSLWSVFWLFKLATGKEGMGYGDFKLLAALGAWLGWTILPTIVLLSSVVGATVGISMIIFARHGRNIPIPFGPYLAAAGTIAMFWGPQINARYLGLLA